MINFFKVIWNIILYIIYVLVFSLIVGMIIGVVLAYYDKSFIGEPTASYIQAGLALFVLFITVVYRKTFYLSLNKKEENKIIYDIKTIIDQKEDKEENIHIKTKNNNDDDLEIVIGKE